MWIRLLAMLALLAWTLVAPVWADEEPVPKTVDGGAAKIKDGGKEIGEGFRGIGRGIKKVFTGERSKEEFEKAGKIGAGFKDLGLGTAGVGRGVGRGVREGFQGDSTDQPAVEDQRNQALEEETLPE